MGIMSRDIQRRRAALPYGTVGDMSHLVAANVQVFLASSEYVHVALSMRAKLRPYIYMHSSTCKYT